MAEMIHFIRAMEAYCQLEVIECSWKILTDFLSKREGDLDALIGAHQSYLDRMVKKVLLLSPKSGKEVSSKRCPFCVLSDVREVGQENLLHQVLDIFATILSFREATVCRISPVAGDRRHFGSQDNFYNYCLSESARRDRQFDAGRVRLKRLVAMCIPEFVLGSLHWP
jgi:gamma-tubulin complex component 3